MLNRDPDRPEAQRMMPYQLVVLVCLIAAGLAVCPTGCKVRDSEDEFTRLMNVGKNYYDKGSGESPRRLREAVPSIPRIPTPCLNLANACLLANQPDKAIKAAQEVLNLDPTPRRRTT